MNTYTKKINNLSMASGKKNTYIKKENRSRRPGKAGYIEKAFTLRIKEVNRYYQSRTLF